jgi:hypothetical protein
VLALRQLWLPLPEPADQAQPLDCSRGTAGAGLALAPCGGCAVKCTVTALVVVVGQATGTRVPCRSVW